MRKLAAKKKEAISTFQSAAVIDDVELLCFEEKLGNIRQISPTNAVKT